MDSGRKQFKDAILDSIVYIYGVIDRQFRSDLVREYYSRLIENKRGRAKIRKLLTIWSRSPTLNRPDVRNRINSISELLILVYGEN